MVSHLNALPLVGLGGDPVYLRLVNKQKDSFGNRPGSLMNEYPFCYSISSYLHHVSAELNRVVAGLARAGVPHGVLKAVHFRLECISHLVTNRLSIIQASADHGA